MPKKRGRRGGNRDGGFSREPKEIVYPPAKDLQHFNPAELLIDKKRKLSLTDSQVTALTAMRSKFFERTGALLARYDSVRADYKPPKYDPRETPSAWTDSLRRAASVQQRLLNTWLDTLMAWRHEDVRATLDFLTDDKQKKTAAELIDKQEEEFLKAIPAIPPSGGRGGGRGGRPGQDQPREGSSLGG